MLKIQQELLQKTKAPMLMVAFGLVGMGLFSYLTFIPEQTSAAEVSTPIGESRTLSGINTMQEMNGAICYNSAENETKQLKDSRDGNLYWVTKLKDGNCWMTQNLDFDIPSTLKASDTDVTSDTTISVTKYNNSTGVGSWDNDNTQTKQYDPGIMYKTNPTGTGNCSGSGITSLINSACATAGWSTSGSDKHYTIGNYYSWNAATAGTGNSAGSTQGTKAAGSICPKGWHLPTAGTGSYNTKVSFAYLLRQYGFATADNAGNVGTTPNSMVDAPMYWLRGGYVYSTNLRSAGSYGYYWSSTVSSGTIAYGLSFNTGSNLNPSNYNSRYLGFPVRCLAKAEEGSGEPVVDNPVIKVTVKPVLTLDVATTPEGGTVTIQADSNKVMTGSFTATVSSNQAYTLALSAAQGFSTALTTTATKEEIPAVADGENVVAGKSAWGIRTCELTNDCADGSTKVFQGIVPFTATPKIFYTSDEGVEAEDTTFQVGIGVDSSLSSGTYATNVVVTAAQI